MLKFHYIGDKNPRILEIWPGETIGVVPKYFGNSNGDRILHGILDITIRQPPISETIDDIIGEELPTGIYDIHATTRRQTPLLPQIFDASITRAPTVQLSAKHGWPLVGRKGLPEKISLGHTYIDDSTLALLGLDCMYGSRNIELPKPAQTWATLICSDGSVLLPNQIVESGYSYEGDSVIAPPKVNEDIQKITVLGALTYTNCFD